MASIETRILVAQHNLSAATTLAGEAADEMVNDIMPANAAMYASAETLLGTALALTRLAEKALGGEEIEWPST